MNLVAAGGVARGWDSEFESALLQRRVCLSRDFIFLGKNPGFPRGFPGCVPGTVDRETQARQ